MSDGPISGFLLKKVSGVSSYPRREGYENGRQRKKAATESGEVEEPDRDDDSGYFFPVEILNDALLPDFSLRHINSP